MSHLGRSARCAPAKPLAKDMLCVAATLVGLAHDFLDSLRRQASERCGETEHDHVGPATRDRLGGFLEWHVSSLRASLQENFGRLALVGVADDEARRVDWN